MLITDTNILQRVSQGRAMNHVVALRRRGVRLATTDRNAFELHRNLIRDLGFSETDADVEVERVLAPFDVVTADEYDHAYADALRRLRNGGKSDWPALAAALTLDGQIWSEDVDFFGVGVPIWTTSNVYYAQEEEKSRDA